MRAIGQFLYDLSQKMIGDYNDTAEEKQLDLPALVEQARKDWLTALALFENVCEKELVDQAIYNLNAAERRYVFLLSEIKKEKNREIVKNNME